MALSLNNIDINCSAGLKVADGLDAQSGKLREAQRACEATVSDIQASWSGSSAKLYIARITRTIEALGSRADDLDAISGAIRQTVAVYRSEQTALYNKEQEQRKQKEQQKAASSS